MNIICRILASIISGAFFGPTLGLAGWFAVDFLVDSNSGSMLGWLIGWFIGGMLGWYLLGFFTHRATFPELLIGGISGLVSGFILLFVATLDNNPPAFDIMAVFGGTIGLLFGLVSNPGLK